MERCCHARCAGVPSTRSRQQHERRRAADLDIRTLHGRQAPPPGRQPTIRRQSRPHSGPRGPSKPVNAVSQRRWLRPVRHAGVLPGRNRRPRVRSSSCCSARCTSGTPERSAADLGIRTPPRPSGTTARPSADHSASRPHSGPLRAFQTRRCTSGHPREIRKVPVNAVSQRRWLRPVRHAGTRTLNINPIPALRRRRGTLKRITASLTQIGQTLGWLSWHPSTCAISRPSPAPLQAAVCHPRSFDPRGGPRSSRTRHGRRNRGRSAHGPQPGAPSVGAAHLPPDH